MKMINKKAILLSKGDYMSKIKNDKYYTPYLLAKYCIDKTYEIIGEENISEVIEPSAGNGSFSLQIPAHFAYDIEPEDQSIINADFLKLNISYLPGRLIIGNPPYGKNMNLAQKFYKKSVIIGDCIAFILPISQLDNQNSLYEFDLIYSEDLGKQNYSGVELHCCFNIYKRPDFGLNKKDSYKLKDIVIVRQDSKKYNEIQNYDIRMCYWGDGSAGKILKEAEKYSAEYKIIVKNNILKDKVIKLLKGLDWHKELNCIAMLKIQQFHIHKTLKKYIPELN